MSSTRKRSDHTSLSMVPAPRKVRKLSGFNCWHRQFLQSPEGKMLSSLSEKNKVSACKWRALSDNEREAFNKQANSEQAKSSPSAKKEMRKALSSLTNIVEHMKSLDCEVMYTVVKKNDHYCGGTDQGISYLQREIPWLPYSFMGSLSRPSTFPTVSVSAGHKGDTLPSLHVRVEALFNHLYGVAVKKQNVRLPYSKINEYGIHADGLPENKILKHPSSYGKATLQAILDDSKSVVIRVQNPPGGVTPEGPTDQATSVTCQSPSTFLSSMSLSETVDLSTSETSAKENMQTLNFEPDFVKVVKPTSANPIHHDHGYYFSAEKAQMLKQKVTSQQKESNFSMPAAKPRALSSQQKGSSSSMPAVKPRALSSQQKGSSSSLLANKVTLYDGHRKAVGMGTLMQSGANLVHGQVLKEDCVKVIINYVKPETYPPRPSAFDADEPLAAGQFTMWPKDQIGH